MARARGAGGNSLNPIAIQAAGVLPSTVIFSNNVNSYTINGPGGIGGTAGVYLLGSGSVTFGGANSYSGAIT